MPPTDAFPRAPLARDQLLRFELAWAPPYDWGWLLTFLSRRLIAGVECVGPQAYSRVVRLRDGGGWAIGRVDVRPCPSRAALVSVGVAVTSWSLSGRAVTAEGLGTVYLDGRTRDRAARIEQFRDGNDPVFLISLKAGGFGLTLTEADYVFILDPWWNPAAELQAIDRTHRIGQDKHVMVYRLVSADTIEEKVVALQARKRDLFDKVVGEAGDLAAPLTADDIRGLLEP